MSEVAVRWMVRQDIDALVRIENEAYDIPWARKSFISALQKVGTVGLVVETENEIIGYVIYITHRSGAFPLQEMSSGGIEILNLTVSESSRGDGIGTIVVEYLKDKIRKNKRHSELLMVVGDDALGAQLFLVSQDFQAVRVLHEVYDNGEDAYLLSWSEEPDLSIPAIRWANRIASYL